MYDTNPHTNIDTPNDIEAISNKKDSIETGLSIDNIKCVFSTTILTI